MPEILPQFLQKFHQHQDRKMMNSSYSKEYLNLKRKVNLNLNPNKKLK